MNWEQMKCNENRRIMDAIEARRARKAEDLADWIKIIGAMVLMVVLTVAAWLIVKHEGDKADEAYDRVKLMRDARTMTSEATDALSRNPNDGLAWLAFVLGSAITEGV